MKWGNNGRLREEYATIVTNRALSQCDPVLVLRHIHSQQATTDTWMHASSSNVMLVSANTMCSYAILQPSIFTPMKATTTINEEQKIILCTRQCLPISVNVYVIIACCRHADARNYIYFHKSRRGMHHISTESFNSCARDANLVKCSKIIAIVVVVVGGDDGF